MRRITRIHVLAAIFLAVLTAAAGCATTERVKGVYHRVQPNETLSKIARLYDTTPENIARANNIHDVHLVKKDSVLFIPDAAAPRRLERTEAVKKQSAAPAAVQEQNLAPSLKREASPPRDRDVHAEKKASTELKRQPNHVDTPPRFQWPFSGTVTSRFGARPDGIRMNGITFESKNPDPVTAVEEGTVLHSAPIKFYGETIIIRHGADYMTIYSQLENRDITTGQRVSRGEIIGIPGKNEEKGNYTLYFEMRRNNRPVDPLKYLPKR